MSGWFYVGDVHAGLRFAVVFGFIVSSRCSKKWHNGYGNVTSQKLEEPQWFKILATQHARIARQYIAYLGFTRNIRRVIYFAYMFDFCTLTNCYWTLSSSYSRYQTVFRTITHNISWATSGTCSHIVLCGRQQPEFRVHVSQKRHLLATNQFPECFVCCDREKSRAKTWNWSALRTRWAPRPSHSQRSSARICFPRLRFTNRYSCLRCQTTSRKQAWLRRSKT